jgi:hypothetical protein
MSASGPSLTKSPDTCMSASGGVDRTAGARLGTVTQGATQRAIATLPLGERSVGMAEVGELLLAA